MVIFPVTESGKNKHFQKIQKDLTQESPIVIVFGLVNRIQVWAIISNNWTRGVAMSITHQFQEFALIYVLEA